MSDPAPSELVSRFLRQSNQYTASTGRVSPKAFHPRDQKTSVFRVQRLEEHQIWSLADTHMVLVSGNVRARAELSVEQVIEIGLRVERAEPPPLHANIVDWPGEKDKWMSKAQELAAVATLRIRS